MAFAFTVEDGTGVAGANSYVDVAYADDYHSGRGNGGWGGTDAQKQAALVKATDHVERVYGPRFIGERGSAAQGLHWPALSAFEWPTGRPFPNTVATSDEVPDSLKRAVCEFALRALTVELTPDSPAGGTVVEENQRSGMVERELKYANPGGLPDFPSAELWMRSLLLWRRTERA